MGAPRELPTARLVLRRWRDEDREAFSSMCDDERVMEFLPALSTRADRDAAVGRILTHFERHDFGLWAVEIRGVTPFAGWVGLHVPGFEAAFTPCVEIGWRLGSAYWGRGYATEAANAAVACGFNELQLPEILSWTVPMNMRSRRVMERIGMLYDAAADFDHPLLPDGHPLRRHVLYRLTRERWQKSLA